MLFKRIVAYLALFVIGCCVGAGLQAMGIPVLVRFALCFALGWYWQAIAEGLRLKRDWE